MAQNITALPDEYLYVLMNQYGLSTGIDPAIQEKYKNMDPIKLNQMSADMQNPNFWKQYDMEATGNYIMGQKEVPDNKLSSQKLNELYTKYQSQGGSGQLWDKSSYDANGKFVGKMDDYNKRAGQIAQYGAVGGYREDSDNPYEQKMSQIMKNMDSQQAAINLHKDVTDNPDKYGKAGGKGYLLNDPEGIQKQVEDLGKEFKDLKAKSEEWTKTAEERRAEGGESAYENFVKTSYKEVTGQDYNAGVNVGGGVMRNRDGTYNAGQTTDPYTLSRIFGMEPNQVSVKMAQYFTETGKDPKTMPTDYQPSQEAQNATAGPVNTSSQNLYDNFLQGLDAKGNPIENFDSMKTSLANPNMEAWGYHAKQSSGLTQSEYMAKKNMTMYDHLSSLYKQQAADEAQRAQTNQAQQAQFQSQPNYKQMQEKLGPGVQPTSEALGMTFQEWLDSETGGKANGYTGGYTSDNYLWQQQNPDDPDVKLSSARAEQARQAATEASGMSYFKPGSTWASNPQGWANDGNTNVYYGSGPMPSQQSLNGLFSNNTSTGGNGSNSNTANNNSLFSWTKLL